MSDNIEANQYWPVDMIEGQDGLLDIDAIYARLEADKTLFGLDLEDLVSIGKDRAKVEAELANAGRNFSWYQLSEKEKVWYGTLRTPINEACEEVKNKISVEALRNRIKFFFRVSPSILNKTDAFGNTKVMTIVKNLEANLDTLPWLPVLIHYMQPDKLFLLNNSNEDLLCLASLYCPSIPEVAGYIASIYTQRQIDLNSIKYTHLKVPLLHAIILKGDTHVNILHQLLKLREQKGQMIFDVSITDENGITPLYLAVETHNTLDFKGKIRTTIKTVSALMQFGSDVLKQHPDYGYTPLHLAIAINPVLNLIKELLFGSGAQALRVVNKYGFLPQELIQFLNNNEVKNQIWQLVEQSLRLI